MGMRQKIAIVCFIMCVFECPVFSQITRWDTGDVIPGTEDIIPGPWLQMRGWNLDDHHLRFADFSGGLDLSNSDFRNCSLEYASFNGANLSGAFFVRETTLSNADFRGSILNDVTFGGVGLANSSFHNTDISHAQFYACSGFTANQLYSTTNYQSGNLNGVFLDHMNMSGWDFSNMNLNGVWLCGQLTGADFTNAVIAGACVGGTGEEQNNGFTTDQLYSTRSYQIRDLQDVGFRDCDLSGSDFSNQNLLDAVFLGVNLSGVDFSTAQLKDACFRGDFAEMSLRNASFRDADLQNVVFENIADFSGADFTDACISGARFSRDSVSSISAEQFYSTESYQIGDLRKIFFHDYDLSDWNLENQNLVNSSFEVTTLTGTVFSGSDLRGAVFLLAGLDEAFMENTILPNGVIKGMVLEDALTIRDYDGGIDIAIEDEMLLGSDSKIELFFEDMEWGSTITLNEDISLDLAGTLYLGVTDDADLDMMVGAVFQIFDWNGNEFERGYFDNIAWDQGFEWDVSNLYTMGMVRLIDVPEPGSLLLIAFGAGVFVRKRRS